MDHTVSVRTCSKEDDEATKMKEISRRIRAKTELPEDVIIEIFLRLPIKSLARFKFACKVWYDLILSPDFITIYENSNYNNNQKTTLSSLYCHCSKPLSRDSTTISFRFNDVLTHLTIPLLAARVKIVGCSNGVVCLSLSQRQDRFALWNPVTRAFRCIGTQIPSTYSSGDEPSCGFCFDPVANALKVVRIEFGESRAQVDVYWSTADSWSARQVYDHTRGLPTCKCWSTMTAVTCAGRCMYWIVGSRHRDTLLDHRRILCFDMVDDLFTLIDLPRPDNIYHKLVNYGDSLAVFVRYHAFRGLTFGVWMIDNSGMSSDQSLTKRLNFRPDAYISSAVGFLCKDKSEWAVLSSGSEYYLCDPKTGVTEKFFMDEHPDGIFQYSESFASVD